MSILFSAFLPRPLPPPPSSSSSSSRRRPPSAMESVYSIVLGLGVRAVVGLASHHDFKVAGPLIGVWEGVVTLHFLKKMPSSFDPYIAYAVRMFIDFLVTESLSRMVLVIIWTALGLVLADVAPALWLDVGLHRPWRRLRRDLYKIYKMTPKVPNFPRSRVVRFSRSRHSIIDTPLTFPEFELEERTTMISDENPPASVIEERTEPTSVTRRRVAPGHYTTGFTTSEAESTSRRRPSSALSTPIPTIRTRRATVYNQDAPSDTDAESRSSVFDVDGDNLSSGQSSSASTESTPEHHDDYDLESFIESAPEIDAEEEVAALAAEQQAFVAVKKEEEETTPRARPMYLPPTPSDSAAKWELSYAKEEPILIPPPSAFLQQIPDDTQDWDHVPRKKELVEKPPPTPAKDDIPLRYRNSRNSAFSGLQRTPVSHNNSLGLDTTLPEVAEETTSVVGAVASGIGASSVDWQEGPSSAIPRDAAGINLLHTDDNDDDDMYLDEETSRSRMDQYLKDTGKSGFGSDDYHVFLNRGNAITLESLREKERLEKEKAENDRLEKERLERERLKLEEERLKREKFEQERLKKEKLEQERLQDEERRRKEEEVLVARRRAEELEKEARRRKLEEKKLQEEQEAEERKRHAEEEKEKKRLAKEERKQLRLAAKKKEEAEARAALEAEESRLAEEAERKRVEEAQEVERLRLEAKEEAERQRQAEEVERQQAAEAERVRLEVAEAERLHLAEEEAERQRLAEEVERKRFEAEEQERKRLEEEQWLAEEAEQARLAEEERQRLAEEAERQRVANEEARIAEEVRLVEEARIAKEAQLAEEARLAKEAEEQQLAKARIAEEAQIAEARLAQVVEEKRLAEEEAERQRLAEEEEIHRIAEEAKRQLEAEAVEFAHREELRQQFIEEERRRAEQEADRLQFERRVEEEERKKREEEEFEQEAMRLELEKKTLQEEEEAQTSNMTAEEKKRRKEEEKEEKKRKKDEQKLIKVAKKLAAKAAQEAETSRLAEGEAEKRRVEAEEEERKRLEKEEAERQFAEQARLAEAEAFLRFAEQQRLAEEAAEQQRLAEEESARQRFAEEFRAAEEAERERLAEEQRQTEQETLRLKSEQEDLNRLRLQAGADLAAAAEEAHRQEDLQRVKEEQNSAEELKRQAELSRAAEAEQDVGKSATPVDDPVAELGTPTQVTVQLATPTLSQAALEAEQNADANEDDAAAERSELGARAESVVTTFTDVALDITARLQKTISRRAQKIELEDRLRKLQKVPEPDAEAVRHAEKVLAKFEKKILKLYEDTCQVSHFNDKAPEVVVLKLTSVPEAEDVVRDAILWHLTPKCRSFNFEVHLPTGKGNGVAKMKVAITSLLRDDLNIAPIPDPKNGKQLTIEIPEFQFEDWVLDFRQRHVRADD